MSRYGSPPYGVIDVPCHLLQKWKQNVWFIGHSSRGELLENMNFSDKCFEIIENVFFIGNVTDRNTLFHVSITNIYFLHAGILQTPSTENFRSYTWPATADSSTMKKPQRTFLIKGKHSCTCTKIYPIERCVYFDYNVVLSVFIRIHQTESIPESVRECLRIKPDRPVVPYWVHHVAATTISDSEFALMVQATGQGVLKTLLAVRRLLPIHYAIHDSHPPGSGCSRVSTPSGNPTAPDRATAR